MFQKKLDAFLEEYCKLYKFSGSLRVTHKDKVIYQRFMGYADWEKQIPFTERSMFNFYSVTKLFCAIGLMKLKDKGLVDIDLHPGTYVPQMQGFDERLTIRHMLCFESGLPDFLQTKEFAEKYVKGPPEKARDHMQLLSAYPMRFAPGTDGMYVNVNYVGCALIIENVSGLSYADYMHKEVFEPLGMKTARIDADDLYVENRVKGYELDADQLVHVKPALDWVMGAGDMIGTVDDLYCIHHILQNRSLLTPQSWEEVLKPSPLSQIAMGCMVFDWHGKTRITQNGGHKGFRNIHVQLPEDDFDIILLSNCGYGDSRYAITEAVHQAYYGESDDASRHVKMDTGYIPEIHADDQLKGFLPKKPEQIVLNPEDETALPGQYGPYIVTKGQDYYSIIETNGKTLHCYPIGDGVFANLYIDEKYLIQRDADGDMCLFGHKKEK